MKKPFGIVVFDVDSTLVTIEGIDHLAAGDPRIAELTDAAMNGAIPIDDVYGRRLEIVRPDRRAIERLSAAYIEHLLPDAAEVIQTLRSRNIDVHLVSGGIEQAILPLAQHLGLTPRAVHAVRLEFASDGTYQSFDSRNPLTRNGGKETVVINIRVRAKGRVALIGDGVSDLEARRAVDVFIGFGGVIARERVRQEADHFINVPSLRPVLDILEEA